MGGEVEGGKKGLELMHVWVLMCFSEDPLFHSFHYLLRLSLIQRKARNIVLKIFISIKEYIYIYISEATSKHSQTYSVLFASKIILNI